jgi:Family of unknown function (DUF6310)
MEVIMRIQGFGVLLLLLSSCATSALPPKEPVSRSHPLANLRRAVALPWKDEGRCVVAEAANPWPVVVERCFHALDTRKLRFRDVERRCPVASVDAATMETMVAFCLLTQPELVVGAVVVVSAFVVAVAIVEAIDRYELKGRGVVDGTRKTTRPGSVVKPSRPDPLADQNPGPKKSSLGPDLIPPNPGPTERRLDCMPKPVPHLGGDALHNLCADRIPENGFSGSDVLVNGKRFDALQPGARMLWEVKTDNFDAYPDELKTIVLKKQEADLRAERDLAEACGFAFTVGVRSAAHRRALLKQVRFLEVVIMDWC